MISRRKFLNTTTLAGASFLFKPFGRIVMEDLDPKVKDIVLNTIGIDTHNHIDVPLDTDELPGPIINFSKEMINSGLSAICMTFATDYKNNVQPGEAYQRFLNGISAMDTALNLNKMSRSLTKTDIINAHNKKQPTVVQSVEGCHFLEGNLDRVEIAYNKGLRHLGLLHDSDASVPLGDVYTNPIKYNGLTDLGKNVIKECNRLGILIDMAHADNQTINDAIQLSTTPIIISHTGLNTQLGNDPFMAKMMLARLIGKDEAKIVANAGGVIGVWTHLADTSLEYAKNIKAMVDLIGIDHVCIGTDTKLTPQYNSPKSHFNGFQSDKKQDSLHRKEEHKEPPHNKKRMGNQTNSIWEDQKFGFYYVVVDALLKIGFNKNDIAKIGGENYLRVFNASMKA